MTNTVLRGQALRDGDRVWATIDTGSNQDGHSVTPISAPSGDQQIKLLDHVYKMAGVDINKIDYIEAHGKSRTRALTLI